MEKDKVIRKRLQRPKFKFRFLDRSGALDSPSRSLQSSSSRPPELSSPDQSHLQRETSSLSEDSPSSQREAFSPLREGLSPLGETSSPSRETLRPDQQVFSPSESVFSPSNEPSSPYFEHSSPTSETPSPSDESPSPSDEPSSPSDDPPTPYGEVSTPSHEPQNSAEVEVVTVDDRVSDPSYVVDLTKDTTDPSDDIVDLTDSIIEPDHTPPKRSRRSLRLRSDPHELSSGNVVLSSDSDSDSDLILLNSPKVPQTFPSPSERTSSSTQSRVIKCPICFDDDSKIRATYRNLMSTSCGHIFCDSCLKTAVTTQHKCPTCRKKLTMRSIHNIYI